MSTLENLEALLNNLERIHESQWIKDIGDHTYLWEKHLEKFKVIGAQKVKEIKEIHTGEKCRHTA